MLDPIYLILIFFGFTLLFMIGILAFVYDVRHILKETLSASKETQKSTQGMWYISHDQKRATEGVWSELLQQNKFIKKKEGVIISGPLPAQTDPLAVPAAKAGRSKKEKALVTQSLSPGPDSGHAITVTNLPAIRGESARPQ